MYIAQSKYTKLCYSFLVPIHVCSFHSFSNFFHRQAEYPKEALFTIYFIHLYPPSNARIMISILVLNPFSVLHLSFPLFLTSFILAPIVWLPETLFDTQSLKKNVFEVTSDQIFLQIFHFFSLVIPIYQLHRQSFFLCNSSFPIFCYNSKACTFVFQQKLSITSFHFSPFH